jgi:hypothetical protein
MSIPNDYFRCQGRYGVGPARMAVLASECVACNRRTDVEPDTTYAWLTPPKDRPCSARIEAVVIILED